MPSEENITIGLTEEILVDAVTKFQKEGIQLVIGFTFNPSAWQAIKDKFKKLDNIDNTFNYRGLPCYVLNKQEENCIGWYNKEMMDLFIEADGSKWVEKLPVISEKE